MRSRGCRLATFHDRPPTLSLLRWHAVQQAVRRDGRRVAATEVLGAYVFAHVYRGYVVFCLQGFELFVSQSASSRASRARAPYHLSLLVASPLDRDRSSELIKEHSLTSKV